MRMLRSNKTVYGVTSVGARCQETHTATEAQLDFQNCMPMGLQVGMGEYFSEEETAAIVLVRLLTLSKGYSGVSTQLVDRLTMLLNHGILPLIPEQGSVGASGDLAPNAYIACTVKGIHLKVFRFGCTFLDSRFCFTPLEYRV